MNVLSVLGLIFIVLAAAVFQKSSIYLITGTFMNVLLFIGYLILINQGFSVYFVTLGSFLGISLITLFYINGVNRKTKIAFLCVLLFSILFTIVIVPLSQLIRTQGFAVEEIEELASFDFFVDVPFTQLNISLIIMSFSGAVIDGSMAICSSTFEIYEHFPTLSLKELTKASFNVVSEALNSTLYTLLFAFIASSFALIIWLQDLHYSFVEIINSKVFISELLISILTGVAAILILPVSAIVGSYFFVKNRLKNENRIN